MSGEKREKKNAGFSRSVGRKVKGKEKKPNSRMKPG